MLLLRVGTLSCVSSSHSLFACKTPILLSCEQFQPAFSSSKARVSPRCSALRPLFYQKERLLSSHLAAEAPRHFNVSAFKSPVVSSQPWIPRIHPHTLTAFIETRRRLVEKVLCTDVRAIFVINNRHLEKGLGHLQQCWKKPWKDAPGLQPARKRQQLPLGQLLFYQLPQHLKASLLPSPPYFHRQECFEPP